MEYLVLIVLVTGFTLVYFKKESTNEDDLDSDIKRILELERVLAA